jgi:hypothetical protein
MDRALVDAADDGPEVAGFLEDTQPLPKNVILFPNKNVSVAEPVGRDSFGVDAGRTALVEADPANPDHQPTALFGRAALHLPQWPLVLVFGSIAVSLLVVLFDTFRGGVLVLGAAMFLAFFLRLVLNDRDAGMLKVRSRVVDLVILGTFAVSITGLALSIPTAV